MTITRADVGFRSERGPILVALMLTTGLVAIDSTIVATAVPSIVNVGGFSSFPWLFSAYMLAQAVPVPVYLRLLPRWRGEGRNDRVGVGGGLPHRGPRGRTRGFCRVRHAPRRAPRLRRR